MANHALSDIQRRLIYCESEKGGVLSLDTDVDACTYSVHRAYDGSQVYAAGTTRATIETHCVNVDPTLPAAA
jgi:hypothetical protein